MLQWNPVSMDTKRTCQSIKMPSSQKYVTYSHICFINTNTIKVLQSSAILLNYCFRIILRHYLQESLFFHTASSLSRVTCVQTNLDEEPEAVRDEFHNFLAKVISNWTDKRDQEELSIMNT